MNHERGPGELVRRLRTVGLAMVGVVAAGTAGYVALEGWPVGDALYMTVITVSTVGFGETRPLDPLGRVLTVAIILGGSGVMAFMFGSLVEYVVSGQLSGELRRRRVQRDIDRLNGHYIVCGHGRVGQEVIHDLEEKHAHAVIIDRTEPDDEKGHGHPSIEGDATDDAVLRRAGIERARGLVAATGDDAINIVITLTARALNPDLVIISRASLRTSEAKLLRAGATHVVSPYTIGGRRMATQLLNPKVNEFLDRVMHARDVQFWLEEVRVERTSPLAGRRLGEAVLARVNLLAVAPAGRPLVTNPGPDYAIGSGDILIGFGTRDELKRLATLASGNGRH